MQDIVQAGLGYMLFYDLSGFMTEPWRPEGPASGLFLFGYGVFRFCVEFLRAPDAQLGSLLWNWVTMGQILSIPMVLIGAFLLIRSFHKGEEQTQ
ncbi:MAG: prolipoprotein diacylglyceryl transferase family protein [Desulfobacterales bacterium]|nr:prolipoprotein diacylglyceryl transferase family protein [Desulfobacterales bacterium]